jgi:hypothetical protein
MAAAEAVSAVRPAQQADQNADSQATGNQGGATSKAPTMVSEERGRQPRTDLPSVS